MNKRTKIILSILVMLISLFIIGGAIVVYISEKRIVDVTIIISALISLTVAVLNMCRYSSEL